jgi:hypothetical protein
VKVPGQKSPKSSTEKGLRVPKLPRKVREDIRLTPSQVEEINARNPIMPPTLYGNMTDHV